MEFTNLKMEDYPSFLKLYNESFPPDERRELKDFLASLSYWTFEGYTYIEHFAVVPEHRGKRIGALMLNHLFKEVSPNVLIEVEKPEGEEQKRRIKFYERNGFRVREEFDYTQPAYSSDKSPVEMLLMTHGDVDLHNRDSIREMLREVYNCNE